MNTVIYHTIIRTSCTLCECELHSSINYDQLHTVAPCKTNHKIVDKALDTAASLNY